MKWNKKKVCLWDGTVRADDSLLSSRRRGQSTQKDHFYFPFLFLLSILAFFFFGRECAREWTAPPLHPGRSSHWWWCFFFFFFVSFLFVWFFGRVDVVIFDLGDGGRLNWRKMEMTKWEETKKAGGCRSINGEKLDVPFSTFEVCVCVCGSRSGSSPVHRADVVFQLLWLSRREESQSLDLIGFGTLASSLYLSILFIFIFPFRVCTDGTN